MIELWTKAAWREFFNAWTHPLRWRHPLQGLISPMQFIEMAKRNGSINEIGPWVTNKAIQALAALDRAGAGWVRLSVNVSPRQFLGTPTAGWAMLLRDHAIDSPERLPRLELELTEGTIHHDQRLAYALLAKFKDGGLCIALDNFGTDYSSLSQIMELPLDGLKLDRSLILDLEHNPRSRTMVPHLTRMSHDSGLKRSQEASRPRHRSISVRNSHAISSRAAHFTGHSICQTS